MKLHCTHGSGHVVPGISWDARPSELVCPTHGTPLKTGMQINAAKKSRQRGGRLRDRSEAEAEAAAEFSRLVREWPCWARKHRPCEHCEGRGFAESTGEVCGTCNGDGKHRCRGPKNAHHLVPVDWMRDTFSDLPEADFLEIAYDPALGAPACQHNFHAALEARSDLILWHELDDEVKLLCQRIDERHPDRPSMLERLRLESPERKAAA